MGYSEVALDEEVPTSPFFCGSVDCLYPCVWLKSELQRVGPQCVIAPGELRRYIGINTSRFGQPDTQSLHRDTEVMSARCSVFVGARFALSCGPMMIAYLTLADCNNPARGQKQGNIRTNNERET